MWDWIPEIMLKALRVSYLMTKKEMLEALFRIDHPVSIWAISEAEQEIERLDPNWEVREYIELHLGGNEDAEDDFPWDLKYYRVGFIHNHPMTLILPSYIDVMDSKDLLQIIENPDYGSIAYIYSDTLDDMRFRRTYEDVLSEKDIKPICTLDFDWRGEYSIFRIEDGVAIIDEVLRRCSTEYPEDVYIWRRKNGIFKYKAGMAHKVV